MKKSISKVIMLTFAVVLMFSTLGLTTAFAADKTVALDSGAVTVSPSNAPGVVNVLQGGKTVITLSAATNDILVLKGALPVNNTAVPITIGAGLTVSIRFANAVNIAAPVGLPVMSIPASSAVNLAAPSGATLMGGNSGIVAGVAKTASPAVSGGGTLAANSGVLTLARGIAGTLKVNGAAVTLTQNEANGITANAVAVSAGAVTVNNGTVNGSIAVSGNGIFNLNAGSATNTVTVSGGTFSSKGNVSGAVTINGGMANITNGTVSAPIAISKGAFNLNAGSATNTVTVSGGTFSSKGNVSGAVNVTGGVFNLSAGSITNTVTIGGGTFNLNAGTANGAVTLNSGALTVAKGATPPANLKINGGTYNNSNTPLYSTKIIMPYSPTFSGKITFSYQNATANINVQVVTATVTNGVFFTNLPAGSTNITVTGTIPNDDISYRITGAVIKTDGTNEFRLICDGVVVNPSDYTTAYTGTRFTDLGLPKQVTVRLSPGSKTAPVDVTWSPSGYSSSTTSKQIIKGTINPPPDIIVAAQAPNATINIILKRSSGGGTSSKEPNYEYEFWSDILGEVENASGGETVYAYANKYDNVPSTILEKMKGKNITLVITRSSGSDITIKGKNIKSLEAGRITYSLAQLSSLSKNQWSSKASAPIGEPTTNEPTTAPSTAPSYNYTPPASSKASSSSSSEESAASPEVNEESSSEEEEIVIDSEPEVTPTDTPTDVKPKAKLSPVSVAIIITVIAAVLSGIIACIILQRRSKHDQF